MKITGSHVVRAPRQRVWDALQDPAVLVQTIPGCHELTETGDGAYAAQVHAGIASIKGTYDGTVQLGDQDPPTSYTLRAIGSGGPGTIDATATVSLTEDAEGTRVDYDADAVIGGAIAGVGQRVVVGVAKRNAATFFDAVDRHLAGELVGGRDGTPAVAGDEVDGEAPTPAGAGPTVYRRPAPTAGGLAQAPAALPLILAALAGAAIALAGVMVGQRRRA
jgi:carbon monoxide dehydrogenase subunit G